MANTTSPNQQNAARTSNPSGTAADLKAKAQDIKEGARDVASSLKDKATDAASNLKDAASNLKDKAADAASNLKDKAKDAASSVGQKAEEATTAVGSGMQSLAGTIRESAPHDGMVGRVSETLAGSLDSGGRYLKEEGLAGLGEDLSEIIRTYPIPSVLVGIGLGFLLARATRS